MKRRNYISNGEIQRIIRDYELLQAKKMYNSEEIDKFLEKYNIPKLNQEETANINNHSHAPKLWLKKKIFHQTSAQGQIPSQVNSTKSLEN